MTLEEIRASGKAFLTPAEAAGPLRCDPQALRLTAQQHPEKLGFPVVCVGKRTKIPTHFPSASTHFSTVRATHAAPM